MNEMTPADYAAINGNNDGFGGNGAWWLIILFIFGIFGWGGRGGFGGGATGGVQDGYVLTSDFAQVDRKLDGLANGISSLGYEQLGQMNGINTNVMQTGFGIQTQLADCCCKTQSGIERINTNIAMGTGDIKAAIKDCCCDTEKQFMQTRFDAAQQNCGTLQAIDRAADRIIDYMVQDKAQALRDENQALRLAASQQAQNTYLINQLRPMPIPAFPSCNPWAASYGNTCGCNGTWG